MKINSRIKLIASSVALLASLNAVAGLGGLQVNSNLGEPFSGSVTVTGNEAKALQEGGKVTLSNSNIKASVKQSGDKAIVSLRSTTPVNDPVLVFQMDVGTQSRQYTAILDPKGYSASQAPARTETAQTPRQAEAGKAVAAPAAAKVDTSSKESTKPAPARAERRQQTAAAGKGQYTVRSGETLTAIAARVRPSGMSIGQAVQELVRSNPEIFPKGNANRTIYPGDVLNITFGTAAVAAAKPVAPAVPTTPPTEQPEAPPAVTTPASAPAEPVASAPVAVPPAEMPASAPEVAASAAASVPVVTAAASAPVVQPAQPAQPAEGGSMWRYLLWGGLGLITLLVLGRLLGKKKPPVAPTAQETSKEADEDLFADDKNIHAAVAGAAAKTAVEDDDLAVDDDFDDDDIFFKETSEPIAQDTAERLDLDFNSIDKQQSAILTGAVTNDEETAKRKDADWEKIESTDSVYEPAPEQPSGIHVKTDELSAEVTEELADNDLGRVDEAPAEPLAFTPVTEPEPQHTVEAPFVPAAEPEVPVTTETVVEKTSSWATTTAVEEQQGPIAMDDSENFVDDLDIGDKDHVIEWEGTFDGSGLTEEVTSTDEPTFVSESVGMTAPLEAKYELAEMYVEIGDPDAARETLNELLEESDGNILAKAKALLAKLDA